MSKHEFRDNETIEAQASLEAFLAATDHLELLESECASLKREVMESIAPQLADIDAEFYERINDAKLLVGNLELQVKQAVIARGVSTANERVNVSFTKPRITWDDSGLQGYALAHPEILKFRKVGAPSASIKYK